LILSSLGQTWRTTLGCTKPVGILPPDQYMAVVLQAAEGCAFNTCTFCDFYRDRSFSHQVHRM